MSSKKQYANIAAYILHNDKKMYELLEYLDILRRITSAKSRLTFVWPDKDVIKKVQELSDSDPSSASLMMSTFVLNGLFCKPSDFRKGQYITTISRRILIVEDVSSNTVNFEGSDFKIIFNKKGDECSHFFVPYNVQHLKETGFAIVESSGIPNASKVTTKKLESDQSKTGSNEQEVADLNIELDKILQNHYHIMQTNGFKAGFDYIYSIFMRVINNAFKEKDTDPKAAKFLMLLKCVSNCYMGISYFLCMYFTKLWDSPNFNLTAYLLRYLKNETIITVSWLDFLAYIPPDSGAAIFDKTEEFLIERDVQRADMKHQKNHEIIASRVMNIYKNLEENNKLGSISNVYPSDFSNFLKANPGILYSLNEIGFIIYTGKYDHNTSKYLNVMQKNIMPCFIQSIMVGNSTLSLINLSKSVLPIHAQFLQELVCCFLLPINVSKEYTIKGSDDDDEDFFVENIEVGGIEESEKYTTKRNEFVRKLEKIKEDYGKDIDITDELNNLMDIAVSEPII